MYIFLVKGLKSFQKRFTTYVFLIFFILTTSGDLNYPSYEEAGGNYIRQNISYSARIDEGNIIRSSAFVISETILISTAHTFQNGSETNLEDYTIKVGWKKEEMQSVSIKGIYIPNNYNPHERDIPREGDIAFIRTSSKIIMPPYEPTLSFATPEMHFPLDKTAFIVGWGLISKQNDSPLWAKNITVNIVDGTTVNFTHSETFIATTVPVGGGFTCEGDSGSPLIVFQDDDFDHKIPIVLGVMVSGPNGTCGTANTMNIFTNISFYLQDPYLLRMFPEFKSDQLESYSTTQITQHRPVNAGWPIGFLLLFILVCLIGIVICRQNSRVRTDSE